MTAQKKTDQQTNTHSAASTTTQTARKPWKKRTPVQVVLDQIDRLREDVTKREEELKQAKRQLQKLDEAKKLFEST